MTWHRAYRAFPLLVLIAATGCDGHEPLAPLFMVVGAPANLTATAISFSQISLSWQDNANSPNESGFEGHRSSTGPAGAFGFIASAGRRDDRERLADLSRATAVLPRIGIQFLRRF